MLIIDLYNRDTSLIHLPLPLLFTNHEHVSYWISMLYKFIGKQMQLILNYFDRLLGKKKKHKNIRDFFKSSKVFLQIAFPNSYTLDLEKQILNSYQNFINKNNLADFFLA